ncbi:MAG: GTP 3',8-cyclase MoaA, partial [Methanothrix sp.]
FCAHCNRLRVTSDGRLKPCLLRNDNLLEIKSTDPDEIERLILEAVKRRAPFFDKIAHAGR